MLRGCGYGLLSGSALVGIGLLATFAFIAISCQPLDLDLPPSVFDLDLSDDEECERSRSPLIAAAANGDADEVASMVDAGVDPDFELAGETALTCAATNRDLEMMTLLLDKGATPSGVAMQSVVGPFVDVDDPHSIEAIRLLLDRGADPNGGAEGPSPLLSAAFRDNQGVVELLLEQGADPNHGGRVHRAYIDLAQRMLRADSEAEETEESTLEQLLPEPSGKTVANVPPLVGAAWSGNVTAATLLLDAGADPNLASDEPFTPILAAALRGDAAMVELLLARGASPTPTVRAGVLTPAEAARAAGHPEVADLIDRGTSASGVPQLRYRG